MVRKGSERTYQYGAQGYEREDQQKEIGVAAELVINRAGGNGTQRGADGHSNGHCAEHYADVLETEVTCREIDHDIQFRSHTTVFSGPWR